VEIMRSKEEFKDAILTTFEKMRWGPPTIYEDYVRDHMSREGALTYGLEHCVFAANFPRWIANVTGNTPHLDMRQYLIEVLYVEEVKDPTITSGHHESLVDFVVALGADRDFVLNYTGAPITKMRINYCDWASRTKPWLEAFAIIAGNEVARGPEMIKRVGDRAKTSRKVWEPLKLDDKALAHWDAAEEADTTEGGHGDEPLDLMIKYADTQEKQDAVLAAIAERQEVNRIWFDQIGIWQFEASGLTPPLPSRQPMPKILMAA
jgi:pyrroloquinoline quinone (PQQ) biosynthesis protein C